LSVVVRAQLLEKLPSTGNNNVRAFKCELSHENAPPENQIYKIMKTTTSKTPTVFALLLNAEQAGRAVCRFRDAGFTADSISLLYPNAVSGTNALSTVNSTKAPEGAVTGATTLGLLGGVGGFLIGIGVLVIPGAGPFLAAGPIMVALSGAAVGAAVGGIGGGLIGLGVPEYEARAYDEKIRQGKTLVAVHCTDSTQEKPVREIFRQEGATDISTSHTTTTTNVDQTHRVSVPQSTLV
jgi:uncharacterized membrane protein